MSAPSLSEELIYGALRQVTDPEIGLNIVDLGLIYGVAISGSSVTVQMTLTTPGCPMSESIACGVQAAVQELPGVEDVRVDVVWEPRWTPEMITSEGKAMLGSR